MMMMRQTFAILLRVQESGRTLSVAVRYCLPKCDQTCDGNPPVNTLIRLRRFPDGKQEDILVLWMCDPETLSLDTLKRKDS